MKKDGQSKEDTYYLGKLDINWADEIDFTFFDIFSKEDKEDLISSLKKLGDEEITINFGTNEYGEYSGNDILEDLEFIEIPGIATKEFIEEHVCGYDNSIMDKLEDVYDYGDDDDDDGDDDDDEIDDEKNDKEIDW